MKEAVVLPSVWPQPLLGKGRTGNSSLIVGVWTTSLRLIGKTLGEYGPIGTSDGSNDRYGCEEGKIGTRWGSIGELSDWGL